MQTHLSHQLYSEMAGRYEQELLSNVSSCHQGKKKKSGAAATTKSAGNETRGTLSVYGRDRRGCSMGLGGRFGCHGPSDSGELRNSVLDYILNDKMYKCIDKRDQKE